jgi:glycosyltransferase involved in cell wall biosynthesis
VSAAPAGAPLRVALMLSGLPSTGAEGVVVHSLADLRDAGVEPVLVTLNTRRDGPLAEEVRAAGIRRIDVDARRMLDPAAIRRLVAVFRREHFAVAHANDQDSIILGGLLRRLTGTPLVLSRHVLVEPAEDARERVRARLVLEVARRAADHVIVVAEAVGTTLSVQTGIPADRITAVHNGVELATYAPDADARAALRAELGWAPETPAVLMVAWFRPGKGHELLADIVPRVASRIPGVRFALAGGGPRLAETRRLLAPYGDTVQFLGHRADVPALLQATDVLLLPSWSEALPTVVIEAGAAGRPVVASDVGGTREIVEDAVTGHLVAPGRAGDIADRLVDVLADRSAAQKMGRLAHERIAAHFTVSAQVRATVDVYRGVAARAGREGRP